MRIAVYGASSLEKKIFREMNYQTPVLFQFIDGTLTLETIDEAKGSDAVSIVSNSIIDDAVARKLKEAGITILTTRSAGVNHIHKDAIKKYGIHTANVPSYSPTSISEFTVLLLLSVLRKMKKNQAMIKRGDFTTEGIFGRELSRMTVGVLGSGRIGAITVRILSGFGCKILIHDVHEKEDVKKYGMYTCRDELLRKSDVVILHYPLLDSTWNVINAETLSMMKDGAVLVNTARGGLVDSRAVRDALDTGKLSAFAFDVYDGEDFFIRKDYHGGLPDDALFRDLISRSNVLYTPHLGFLTEEAVSTMDRISIENAIEFFLTGNCANAI